MEFVVNEAGCRELSKDMLQNMKQIALILSEIQGKNSTLHAALGEDYASIAKSVDIMASELEQAQGEINIIIHDMEEYMARVQQARVVLQ